MDEPAAEKRRQAISLSDLLRLVWHDHYQYLVESWKDIVPTDHEARVRFCLANILGYLRERIGEQPMFLGAWLRITKDVELAQGDERRDMWDNACRDAWARLQNASDPATELTKVWDEDAQARHDQLDAADPDGVDEAVLNWHAVEAIMLESLRAASNDGQPRVTIGQVQQAVRTEVGSGPGWDELVIAVLLEVGAL